MEGLFDLSKTLCSPLSRSGYVTAPSVNHGWDTAVLNLVLPPALFQPKQDLAGWLSFDDSIDCYLPDLALPLHFELYGNAFSIFALPLKLKRPVFQDLDTKRATAEVLQQKQNYLTDPKHLFKDQFSPSDWDPEDEFRFLSHFSFLSAPNKTAKTVVDTFVVGTPAELSFSTAVFDCVRLLRMWVMRGYRRFHNRRLVFRLRAIAQSSEYSSLVSQQSEFLTTHGFHPPDDSPIFTSAFVNVSGEFAAAA